MDNGHLIVLKIAGIEHVGCSLCVKFDKVISSKAGHAYPRMGTMTAINIRIYIYIIRINYIYILSICKGSLPIAETTVWKKIHTTNFSLFCVQVTCHHVHNCEYLKWSNCHKIWWIKSLPWHEDRWAVVSTTCTCFEHWTCGMLVKIPSLLTIVGIRLGLVQFFVRFQVPVWQRLFNFDYVRASYCVGAFCWGSANYLSAKDICTHMHTIA